MTPAVLSAAVLAAAVLLAPPFALYGFKPLETPRVALICAAAGLLASWTLLSGAATGSGPAFAPALGLWLLAGAATGPRPAVHMERLAFMAAAWWLGAVCAPLAGGLAPGLIAAAGGVAAAVHLWQVARRRPLYLAMGSIAGNTNLLATFLVPCVFFAYPVSPILSGLLAASVMAGRCRAAAVGLAVALAVVPAAAPAVCLGGAAGIVLRMAGTRRKSPAREMRTWADAGSLRHRIGIWRCALAQIRRSPWWGTGMGSLKLTAARHRAALGHVATFRHAHCDVLQVVVDASAAGLALWAAMIGAVLGMGGETNPFMAAALSGQLAAGLFFHTLYTPLGMITFAVACGQLWGGGDGCAALAPAAAAAVSLALGRVAVRRAAGHWWFGRYVNGSTAPNGERMADVRHLRAAMRCLPEDNTLLFHAAEAAALTGRPLTCQQYLWAALSAYDGECKPEVIFARMGHHLARTHGIETASAALAQALALDPGCAAAKTDLAMIRSGLTPARQKSLPPAVLARVLANLEKLSDEKTAEIPDGVVQPTPAAGTVEPSGPGRGSPDRRPASGG